MNIVIKRIRVRPETLDGHLYIDGTKICDTAECATGALPEGDYQVTLLKCKQYKRKMLILSSSSSSLSLSCEACPPMEYCGNNSTLPCYCPMLKPGNGVYKRIDGSIIVGTHIVPGCILRSKDAYDPLYQRIRKSLERGNKVILRILRDENK